MSQSTGVAPACRIVLTLAANVSEGTMTSSPSRRSKARNARNSAAVHELTATACGLASLVAHAASNSPTRGPSVSQPERSVRATASMSASDTGARKNGTGAPLRTGAPPSIAGRSLPPALGSIQAPPNPCRSTDDDDRSHDGAGARFDARQVDAARGEETALAL